MTLAERTSAYLKQRGGSELTAGQVRRIRHKHGHLKQGRSHEHKTGTRCLKCRPLPKSAVEHFMEDNRRHSRE